MSRYSAHPAGSALPAGVLLANLGTPDSPAPADVRRYLAEFLSDPRIVERPRWLWKPVLHGIILRVRPRRAAKAYRRIWTEEGSPLLTIGREQAHRLQARLGPDVPVALGMRYGHPSIASALQELRRKGVRRIVVLPLYPQYSATTTGSTFDAVSAELTGWREVPGLHFVNRYHAHPAYLDALAASIREAWTEQPPGERLLFSFHGLPQRYAAAGDPYPAECEATAAAVAERLELPPHRWLLTYQSRFGPEEWLQPYTDETLKRLAAEGVRSVDVVAPGFAADCLETLEEIAMENRDIFREAGGETYRYIPALNARPDHIEMMARIVEPYLGG